MWAQGQAQPEAVALVQGAQQWSYGRLLKQASALSALLVARGVGPEVPVALCLERSPAWVVAQLAILHTGGAYVPLDPQAPPARLAQHLAAVQPPLLLTQRSLAAHLPAPERTVTLVLEDLSRAEDTPLLPPRPLTAPDQLAYILFTSGSTGQPKGVQITQAGLLHLLAWHQQAFALTSADQVSQLASPAFDAAGWELWPALGSGATVHLVEEPLRTQPRALRDWLVQQKITLSFVPTPLAEQLLDLDWPEQTALRCLLTGADTLHRYPPASLPFALINNYGPTEATVVATSGRVWPLADGATPPAPLPPIGRPIGQTEVYLLDEQQQPVAEGAVGEVYLGGVGVARGYLGQPDLTQARFLSHPFRADPGARLYRTGDLARWLPDGQLAFLGRRDQQLKVRGYRIEPEEVVQALAQHPAVQASCVVAHDEAGTGSPQLVAYLVLTPGQPVGVADLRAHLLARVPAYMVPGVFVALDSLPLSLNGKVERAALPAPTPAKTLREVAFVPPNTPLQVQVATQIATLLQLEQVGLDDPFFLLGGHSLLGAQLVAWIEARFGLELPLRTLFEAPTVRQLAAAIETRLQQWVMGLSEAETARLLTEQRAPLPEPLDPS